MLKILLPVLIVLNLITLTAVGQNTNYGTDFWVGYGHHQHMEGGSNSQEMVLYIGAGIQPATVTVTIHGSGGVPSNQWKRVYNIPANTVISTGTTTPVTSYPSTTIGSPMPKSGVYDCRLFSDPPPAGPGSVGFYNNKAIHIESNVPVIAYSHIYGSASSGASLLVPSTNWGFRYYAVNSNQSYAANCFSWMFIIAKEDSTTIMVTPTVPTRGMNLTGLQPNVSKLVTLNKGQIYQVLGGNTAADANGNGGNAITGYELTGTTVKVVPNEHNKMHPVAVFCGSSRTHNNMSCGGGGGDNDMQQLMPVEEWGTEFLTAPMSSSTSASTFGTSRYKIIVSDPTTIINKNGSMMTGLTAGSYYTYESNTADFISADKPIFIAQFMGGGNCLGGGLGDPEMIYLSPVDKAVKKTGFYRTTLENISVNMLTLIVPTPALGSLVIKDGSSPVTPSHVYPHPNKNGYSVVVKRWSPATQAQTFVECDSAFTGITYGMGSVESYGYNIGFQASNYISRTIYHFTGSGDWNNPSAWLNGKVAPLVINAGEEVIIEPSNGTLNYTGNIIVKPGGKLEVVKGKKLNVTGEIIVQE